MTNRRRNIINPIWAAALMIMLSGGDALAGPRKANKSAGAAEVTPVKVVNLNTATSEQLQYLPGIGQSKAKAIIAYRARRKFSSSFQVIRVKGIGRKTYLKLRAHLRVKGETTLSEKLKKK